ncbi:hypothetical protein CC78DRAFT_459120 [Lojkania enalia]|uniref:Small nuclear ribonucleoprotein Prp3 C-terminal domain-containing protein n=1 Tax=Lojkania enalia TaxID=147567 RepID=A0A9P4KE99_9PLEO|nr:hypothetical protein CC78DRAFT_459120 [Didymosphaeria enalia]
MSAANSWHLLPPELIELQIGQVDLLMAMYPEEVVLDQASQNLLSTLRSGLVDNRDMMFTAAPIIPMLLHLPIVPEHDSPSQETLLVDLTVPFAYEGDEPPQEPPLTKLRTRQPVWMSRAATVQLMASIPEAEDLLGSIEYVKETALQHLEQARKTSATQNTLVSVANSTAPLIRAWFYFPSISTRSKRDDFIKYAPSYNLTGFLYAGKPGVLCVEGGSQNVDDYMKFIKTESWGDIPAHHKKVSERYRETGERVFADMQEITDHVGERRGQRANRGDMKALEEWLIERGIGDAFTRVLM